MIFTFTPQGVDSPGPDLFVPRQPFRESLQDWLVDDVDDAIGCRQVGLDDGVLPAGVVHQDEPLHRRRRQQMCVITSDSPTWILDLSQPRPLIPQIPFGQEIVHPWYHICYFFSLSFAWLLIFFSPLNTLTTSCI